VISADESSTRSSQSKPAACRRLTVEATNIPEGRAVEEEDRSSVCHFSDQSSLHPAAAMIRRQLGERKMSGRLRSAHPNEPIRVLEFAASGILAGFTCGPIRIYNAEGDLRRCVLVGSLHHGNSGCHDASAHFHY